MPLRDQMLSALPRIAPRVARFAAVVNALGRLPGRGMLGLAPERTLPRWSGAPWRDIEMNAPDSPRDGPPVALFVDTFSRWFEPENARAAARLLSASGANAVALTAPAGERPLCCGRTYLSAGMVDEAREEAKRLLAAALPAARAGLPIVGLEPSCLYTLRDEIPALFPGSEAETLARQALMLEEYLDAAWNEGRELPFAPDHGAPRTLLRHGHCHQKAFGGVPAVDRMLSRLPGVDVQPIESGCCGMAGAFGYQAEHYETSMAIGELDLLPQVRSADATVRFVADGTSCRAQIVDGTGREAVHAAVVMAEALGED